MFLSYRQFDYIKKLRQPSVLASEITVCIDISFMDRPLHEICNNMHSCLHELGGDEEGNSNADSI